MQTPTSGGAASRGPSEFERAMLDLFKWTALGLSGLCAIGFLAMVLVLSAEAIRLAAGYGTAQTAPTERSLERYIASPPDARPAPRTGEAVPPPVFTSMPEAQRKETYQALYDRIRALGAEYSLVQDEAALVTQVNGAIAELDGANDPNRGTYAYVYLTELGSLAEELGARRAAGDPAVPRRLTLEALAGGLARDLRAARTRPPVPAAPAVSPGPSWTERIAITLALAAGMLVSAAIWAVLSFVAQGRTYWIVQDGGKR